MNHTIVLLFLLNILGDHSIEIKYADLPIHGSPFVVKAYDSIKVRVTDVNNGVVGKFVLFSSKFISPYLRISYVSLL